MCRMDNADKTCKELVKWLKGVEKGEMTVNELTAKRKVVTELRTLREGELKNQIIENSGDKGTKFFKQKD